MKESFGILLCIFLAGQLFAHGGEEHTHATAQTTTHGYFTSEAVSDKYELLVKYEYLAPGEENAIRLFVSEYQTNRPVTGAELKITVNDHPDIPVAVSVADSGIYLLTVGFPGEESYDLTISVNGKPGADLMLVKGIETGKHPQEEETESELNFLQRNPYISIAIAFVLGLVIMFFIRKPARTRANALFFTTLIVAANVLSPLRSIAHEGHDEAAVNENTFSNGVTVPKESQFLFEVITDKTSRGNFFGSTLMPGTVIPSSNGQALLSVPANGKITALNVTVGDHVSRGQQIAVAELQIDPGTMVNLLAERNTIEAEYEAAKSDYDRLVSIQDIIAKKDLTEAEARLKSAEENKKLLNSSNGRAYLITSPIDGIVGNFAAVIGSPVTANETIFTVINLEKIYIEAQALGNDAAMVQNGSSFTIQSTSDKDKSVGAKLISHGQTVNPENQSQRVLFESENAGDPFKIGEFVNILVTDSTMQHEIAIPNTAITEINGKKAVFIKESAEVFSIKYIATGQNNGTQTVILSGLEEGERVVVNATYQMKMIYLKQ